jgi:Mn-containing catalase
METKKRTKQDDIIEYLMNSKRELQEEIRNDVHTKEFKKAIEDLRARNKQKQNAVRV